MDNSVQQNVHVEDMEKILITLVHFVTTHANVVQEEHIMNVPLVMMDLIGMKENVDVFAQQDTGQIQIPILVTDVTEVASLVLDPTKMIVKNHAQTTFTGT